MSDDETKKEKTVEDTDTKMREMKMAKSRYKAVFTRFKNQLTNVLQDEDSEKGEIDALCEKMGTVLEKTLDIMQALSDEHVNRKEYKCADEIALEMDGIATEYSETSIQVKRFFDARKKSMPKHESVATGGSEYSALGKDLWKHMKRVEMPSFHGDNTKYESWKAAFMACIDNAPASPEYKLLQLRQYLKGAALKCIENLGHSEAAYEAAKKRLERKYGGAARVVTRFLNELENFPALRNESARELENFADLFDIAVINLKEVKHGEDLKDGSLYHRLLKKLPQTMLTRYNRQVHEKKLSESVETLRTWINEETEYAVKASETIHGFDYQSGKSQKERSFFGAKKENADATVAEQCKVCGQTHKVWNCQVFKAMRVEDRWSKAKYTGLCFKCLKSNHIGKKCAYQGKCGINGCPKTHNRLLHRQVSQLRPEAEEFQTLQCNSTHSIALRTIPVILKVKQRELKVNALLDDGSTKSYLNEDVASELGLLGEKTLVEVNVINGRSERFETTCVEFQIQGINKNLTMKMEAQTTKNVTGRLKPIDWQHNSEKWPHLQGIQFPRLSKKSKVDLLIGLDYVELHSTLGEIQGHPGEPVARLTPLGWTCVGPVENPTTSMFTFHTAERIDQSLQQFWEVESDGIRKSSSISPRDQDILTNAEKSIHFNGGRYEVSLPWKQAKKELPDNYEMAKKRLESTEKRLDKDPVVKEMYKDTIEGYIKESYVENSEKNKKEEKRWLLPHFPVLRMNKETTKVRIVFDASARYQGVCLNDSLEQGPKLQNSLFDVLMRLREKKSR